MTWKQPAVLWALPALALPIAAYVRAFRRGPRGAALFYPLWLVADAASQAGRVRRHLPAVLFALSLAVIVAGAARPVAPWPVPSGTPVALIIDVSRSMEENDVLPSRIAATRMAALDFVNGLPQATKVALVSFGSAVTVVVPLTDDRDRLREGIRNLSTQLRTRLGPGLLEGVSAVIGEGRTPTGTAPSRPDEPRAIAILLSDGRASDGIPPLQAAAEARRQGVRVHTVGVATTKDPTRLRSGYWGVLDDDTLRAIADLTGGRYYHAHAAGRLREIYREMARIVGWTYRPTEVTAIAGALALALLVASVALRHTASPLP